MSTHSICWHGEKKNISTFQLKRCLIWSYDKVLCCKFLTLFMLINYDAIPTSNFQPIRLLDLHCCYKFSYLMANRADPDQLASANDLDLHCLQRQDPGSA